MRQVGFKFCHLRLKKGESFGYLKKSAYLCGIISEQALFIHKTFITNQ
jgi:hypothetical protein